ncbi:hypothetical protein ACEWY4_017179 [Coilia grayii]|uniref:Zona pellucida sperm-binding protein 3 n=1 Tax=Coilia grayii TaxID=363190 RepID=A0ABD1JG33_9TELE
MSCGMTTFMNLFKGGFAIACLMVFFAKETYPRGFMVLPPVRLSPTPSTTKVGKGEDERRPETLTVRVVCHPDYMAIEMDADLLELGFPVDVADLRLGKREDAGEACRAFPTQPDKYIIAAPLTDCGTQHWITEEYLRYSNTLEYSPAPTPDGLVRTQPASFPIECYYKRKFDLSGVSVLPTWVPYMSTRADQGQLDFSLTLMTDDWTYERAPSVYFLGDVINIKAVLLQFNHSPMRVFVDNCVATLTPDVNSEPRYAFIENNGCMLDSYLTGSMSRFQPRQHPGELHISLDAFRFHQDDRSEIYITCLLKAEPIGQGEPTCRACFFNGNSWRSADGEDWVCAGCLPTGDPGKPSSGKKSASPSSTPQSSAGGLGAAYYQGRPKPRSGPSPWKAVVPTSSGWEREQSLGPITVLKRSRRPLAPEALQGPSQALPESKMANHIKAGPRSYSPATSGQEHPKELSQLGYKDDGFNQFIAMWKKRASPKDWAEMMALLQQTSQTSPAVTSAAAEALPTELPDEEQLDTTPGFAYKGQAKEDAVADLSMDTVLFTPAPSQDLVTSGDATETTIKR